MCALRNSRSFGLKRESVTRHFEKKMVQVFANKEHVILDICHYGNGKINVILCFNPLPLTCK